MKNCIGKTKNNKPCGYKVKSGYCKRHSNQNGITRKFIVCTRCNHNLLFDLNGFKTCETCREKNKKYTKKRYENDKKVENGLKKCLKCKNKKPVDKFNEDGVFCSECLIVKKQEYKNIEIEHKCYKCEKKLESGNICEVCELKRQLEYVESKNIKKDLNKILKDEKLVSKKDYWRNPNNNKKYYGSIVKRNKNNKIFYEVQFKQIGSRNFNNYDDALNYLKSNPYNQNIKNQYRFIGNNKFIEIKLTKGKTTIIDNTPDNLDIIEKNIWCVTDNKTSKTCYVHSYKVLENGKKKTIKLHQLLLENIEEVIDHINQNGLDNRLQNLRNTTFKMNSTNTDGIRKNNKSGIKGVYYDKKKILWCAKWFDENKKQKTKNFSIKKYGEQAHQKAIEYRKQKEQEFYHQNK